MALTKAQIAEQLAKANNLSKAAATDFTNQFFSQIAHALENGEEVTIAGFGNFKLGQRAARTGKNPRTGEPLQIAASKTISFKAGKALKDAVNA